MIGKSIRNSQLEYFISFYFYYLKLPDCKINYAVHWEEGQQITFRNLNATENIFVVENFSYKLLLTRVQPKRIIELINAILLERPIFIVDNDMSEMALILKSILSLIKPLWWVNPLVPMIPHSLAEIVGSPFGALIGIHSDIWIEWWEEAHDIISDDAYILFLDEDETKCKNELTEIPFSEELCESINDIIELTNSTDLDWKLRKEWQQIYKTAGIDRELNINDYSIYAQLKLNQEFFYTIFLKLFKNLSKFIDFDMDKELYLQKIPGWKIFDNEGFLESVHEDDYEFVKQMINTQTFTSFIDKSFKLKNGLFSEEEKDSEKIQFFFRCQSTLQNKNYIMLNEVLESYLVEAIRDYYINVQNLSFEDFKTKYFECLNSSFTGNMNPKSHLLQDSFINSDKQLSIIYKINEKLIMKDIEPPLKIDAKNDISQRNANFSWFYSNLTSEVSKITKSKSSKNIESLGDVEENKTPARLNDTIDTNFDEKDKNTSVYWKKFESKWSAFQSKKMGKTQFFNFKYNKKYLNKKQELNKTPESPEKSNEDLDLPPLGKSVSVNPNPDCNKLVFMQKAKSFKQGKSTNTEDAPNLSTKVKSSIVEIRQPNREHKDHNISEAYHKETYTRKQRKPRIPLIDQCALIVTSKVDESNKGNKTTKPKKLKISQAPSPSNNVSKHMKQMNNEVYSSKKFLVGIETRDTFSNFEDAMNQIGVTTESSNSTSKDHDTSKENHNIVAIQSTKSSISSREEQFEKQNYQKLTMKRGMTVNFAENSEPFIQNTKHQDYTSYACHGRSFRKNRIVPVINSENSRIEEGTIFSNLCLDTRAVSSTKKTRARKYNVEYTKKEKWNYYRNDNYFSSQNWTPNPKEDAESHFKNIFEDESCAVPFRLKTECESDKKYRKISSANKDLNKSYVSAKENTFSKASFVEIQSKEDPQITESKNTINFSTIWNEGEPNESQQLESKSHHKYNKDQWGSITTKHNSKTKYESKPDCK